MRRSQKNSENMLKKLLQLRDRFVTTKFEKSLVDFNLKPVKVNRSGNYEYVRAWTTPLSVSGYNLHYNKISSHLRGLLDEGEYIFFGKLLYKNLKSEVKNYNKENLNETYLNLGRYKYNGICEKLSFELSSLPKHTGKCFRYSTLRDSDIYSQKIKVNDFVMDNSYLATSLYRGSGGKNKWGNSGDEFDPIGYFIINSKTGKRIDIISASNNENEVLFDKETIFKVMDIINISNRTFYIYMNEVLVKNQMDPIKDIYTGSIIA